MKVGPIIAVAGAVGITVGLYFANRMPSEEKLTENRMRETEQQMMEAQSTLDDKVAQAVEIIQGGEQPPMVAIGLLREVLAEDPQHYEALMWMGEFSVMSGQYDKAVDRYSEILNYYPSDVVALNKLVGAYLSIEQKDEAVSALQEFLNENQNHPNKPELEDLLGRIREQ